MGQSGKHRGQYTGDGQKYSSPGNQNQMHYYSLRQGKAYGFRKKKQPSRASLAQNSFLKLTWLLLRLGWHPALPLCSLQLCIFKLCISPGFPGNILLGICLPTKLPLPHLASPDPNSPFHSTFSSPSDTLAPHVPVPPALFCSCEVRPVKPAPPTRERVFTWRPSLTLGQILYRWRVPVLPSSYSH